MSREVRLLSQSDKTTIADNSFWSFLMEVNQAITAFEQLEGDAPAYKKVVDELVGGTFLSMLQNRSVIAMPKLGVSESISKNVDLKQYFFGPVSDREVCSQVLDAGEYFFPLPLASIGEFGIEKRGFKDSERQEIRGIYKDDLYYTYFRPWEYKRAYRIEGRKDCLTDDLFASIKEATKYREIAEPEPQFLVDFNLRQLGAIVPLYGDYNRFRMPFLGYHRTAR